MAADLIRPRRRPGGRVRSVAAAALAGVMATTLLQAPALAQPGAEPGTGPGATEREVAAVPAVPVREVAAQAPPPRPVPADAADQPEPVWPAGGAAVVAVPAAPVRQVGGDPVPDGGLVDPARTVVAGDLPVRVAPAVAGRPPGQVRVEVLDRPATVRAGFDGVLLRLVAQDVAGGPVSAPTSVRLSVGYDAFATRYGADWASRLRLVAVPDCALSTPGAADCVRSPLPSDNNISARTVAATVDIVPGAGTLVGVQAAPSGPAGDYSATSLQPSSTWEAGGNSGGFTWSYPMRVPPGVGGPTPQVALSYASQSVDGRHAASNNQPSWLGEGFEAWPGGYIERRYRGCADDMDGSANNTTETGDLCWATNNAVLNLNGVSGELLFNASEQRWHLRSDDGSRIERRTGASNGDNNGEHWVVTTTDGTEYWFGRSRLPGWSSGDPVTSSTWTVPVFGNHPGEPCHATSFASSSCTQAWRWNLDYVVDVHGNSMSYWYATESNKYARNLDPGDDVSYVRGGRLLRIDYGTRLVGGADSILDDDAPARVVFSTGDRCLSDCSSKTATHWPDTPWDQECTGSTCDTFAPTFWTTKRLASVTTQVWGSSSYRDVERWTLHHSFPDPGDTTRAGLWLDSISHQGLAGGTVSVPDVEFTPVSLDNRVDEIDHSPAMAWHRIARIDTETGGAIAVTYSDRDCESSKPALHTNTRRCYPVFWTPEGETEPVLDWFHKYVVTELREVDMVGDQPEVIYRYQYFGGGAWHYTDDDGLVDDDARTWSVWRGFGRVGVTIGEGDTERTYTESRYFRGMHGDKLPSGTRTVDVTDSTGGTWPDHDWFAGMVREQTTFDGPGGAIVSREIHDPWASSPTASRTIGGTTVHARFTDVETVWSRVSLDGGRGDRVSRVSTTFDSHGMPTQVDDYGDVAVTGDERCTVHTYQPRNTTDWLVDRIHRAQAFGVDCAAAAQPAALDEDDLISDERFSYDGNAHGVEPARGLLTLSEEMSAWNAGTPSYVAVEETTHDAHGRVIETRDALDRPTTTGYSPATGGPVTGTTVTNALGHQVTTTLDPAFGLATRSVDANGKVTDLSYDGLGRLTAVWLPGRDQGTETANFAFDYGIRDTDVSFVTSRRLNPAGNYVTGHVLYDGLLREVQTQRPSPAGGRILTNRFYDNAGREFREYGRYFATGAPSTLLNVPVEPFDVPTQTRTEFDGAGRVTAEVFEPFFDERWRTSYGYGGDRLDVTPPAGATTTSTITNVRGQTAELRQYHGTTPTGGFDSTTYAYDQAGRLAGVTDPAGNEWEYVYDLRGRKVESHDPDSGVTRLEYDVAGQLTGVIDGRNTTRIVYQYDALGRRTHMYWSLPFGTPLALWTYDTAAKGMLDRSVRFVNSQPYTVKVRGYNDRYQPTGIDVTIPSAETGLGGTYTTEYTYHVDGSPDAVAWHATADLPMEGLHYEYDEQLGLPTRLRATLGTTSMTYVTGVDYDALGNTVQTTLRTGEQADAVRLGLERELETGRLSRSWVDLDTAPFVATDQSYEYDPAGNVTRVSDAVPSPDDTQCFGYDYLRRLTGAWTPSSGDCEAAPSTQDLGGPAPYWLSWTYDQVGNRLSETDHQATGDLATTYSYPPAGGPQPHTVSSASTTGGPGVSWTYDAAGNTLTRPDGAGGQQSLVWDHEGRLQTVTDAGGTTRYIYDADGNRLISREPDGKTLYLPGQEVRWDEATDSLTCTRFYEFDGRTIASRDGGGLTWLAGDHQGTALVAIEEQGQQVDVRRQDPFGRPRGAQPVWPNQRGFVGGDVDPTGLVHLGAREYDPAIGRFISVDPLMDLSDPQQMHGYAYANNNPVTWADPTGLFASVGGVPCIDGDCSYHNSDGSVKSAKQCKATGGCGRGVGSSTAAGGGGPAPVEPWQPPVEWFCYDTRTCQEAVGNQVVGFFKGMGEQFLDTVTGTWDAGVAYTDCIMQYGTKLACDQAIAEQIANDPAGAAADAWNDLWGPIADDWGNGNYGEAAGRVGFLIVETVFGTKGAGNALKALRVTKIDVCSFSAATLVLMADGATKMISEIVIGDEVLAADPATGEQSAQTVVAVWVHLDTLINLVITPQGQLADPADRSASVGRTTVTTTADHPFWNHTDQRWQSATSLDPGDRLLAADGTQPAVAGLLPYTRHTGDAYNLTTTGPHTYYVMAGTTPILIHNTCRFPDVHAIRGANPDDVLDHIPDNWIVTSPKKGEGVKFTNPDNPSQVIIYEQGWPGHPDPLHRGPYLRVSNGIDPVFRVPLAGNPGR